MNKMFPNATRIIVPSVLKANVCGHPVCENEHYEEILLRIFGERFYEMGIVDVEITERFVIISVI